MVLRRVIAAASLVTVFGDWACNSDVCEEDMAGATHLLQAQAVAKPRLQQKLEQLALENFDSMTKVLGALHAKLPANLSMPGDLEKFKNVHWTDMHGKICILCDLPLPERTDREYVQRTDCGNHSWFEYPEVGDIPLVTFNREAKDGQPETNAWCELNAQKVCADSIANKDFLMQAKSVEYPPDEEYDLYYCKHNGWLSKEIKALQNDFEGMKARADQECSSRHYENITLNQMKVVYGTGKDRGQPTVEEARFVGDWTCAMGSSGCDMAYCAYSFCELPDGTIGRYGQCEGWDPVKGMPA
eukprot:gb/GFBE01022373.1/.p1 GENE.gb/GFBE01022373.1/~~gb/GFBE01022373.1/.p1  ORF type:complete len:300 (+),score=79.46 gb/GFBE01022373.1/:1-900(+)